tara:strand:- start:191 stop:1078 length:888 start_codon:yes stop_codon:yes gene_type:complete
MLTQLVIHILPEEIDWFEWQSKQLKQGSYYLDNDDKVLVDVTLNLNLVEWKESKLPKKYFVEKFKNIQKLYDWADTNFIADDNNICLGCNDKRRSSINESTSDNIVYLDADIIFNPYTLKYLIDSTKIIEDKYYIISPQIPKMWDNTWDPLVNKEFINISPSHENYKSFDAYKIFNVPNDFNLKHHNGFKMGGGLFNLISTNLLKYIKIPESLGPYGLDDTFIIECAKLMKQQNYSVSQYIIENIVVTENLKYRDDLYSNYLKSIDMKNDFRENSHKVFTNELSIFWEKIKNSKS